MLSFYIKHLFIECKENLPYRDWDVKRSLSGYEILVISHSPTVNCSRVRLFRNKYTLSIISYLVRGDTILIDRSLYKGT